MAVETPEKPKESEPKEETPPEEGMPEEPAGGKTTGGTVDVGSPMGTLMGPEILMLFLAMFLDLVGLILLLFLLDDFFITDIIGIIFIGGWIYFRSQTLKVTRGAAAKIGKAAKQAQKLKWLRPLLIAGEFVPYVGAAPSWTILVWLELQT